MSIFLLYSVTAAVLTIAPFSMSTLDGDRARRILVVDLLATGA